MSAVHLVTTAGVFSLTTRRMNTVGKNGQLQVRRGDNRAYYNGHYSVPGGFGGQDIKGFDDVLHFLPLQAQPGHGFTVEVEIPSNGTFEGRSWHGAVLGAAILHDVPLEARFPLVIVAAMTSEGKLTGKLDDPLGAKAKHLSTLGNHWLIAPNDAWPHLSVPTNDGRRIPITTMESLFRAIRLYLAATSDHVDMVRLILDGGCAAALREELGSDAHRLPEAQRGAWMRMVGPDAEGAPLQWDAHALQRDPLMLAALRATIASAPPPPGRTVAAGRQIRTDINPFSVRHPGCVVILIDQSGSMKDHVAVGGETLRDICTGAVNAALQDIADMCTRQKVVQPRLVVGVIGYGATPASAWGPKLQSWATTGATLVPLSVMAANKEENGQWIAPSPSDESGGFPGTPMGAAIELAWKWCDPWAAEHKESLPPILINITDGVPDAGTEDRTRAAANAFKAIQTEFGNGIVLTYHVSKQSQDSAIQFPNATDVERMTPECRLMFDISSDLPDWMANHAKDSLKGSVVVQNGCRGLVFGAAVTHLTAVLRFASRGPLQL